jgi:hypothetical protein
MDFETMDGFKPAPMFSGIDLSLWFRIVMTVVLVAAGLGVYAAV